MAAASKGVWFSFAKVNQGLKSNCKQAPAGGLEWELIPEQSLTALLPQSVFHFPPTAKE